MTDKNPQGPDAEEEARREEEAFETAQSEAEIALEVRRGLGAEAFEGGIEG
ncbi:hypothetical protein [Microbacterium bovistercoris]|uniref:hypothetical protein n=1 Tax=Microbacterium bovistercoris TaxID=2293570 RepID=UPI0015F298C9|nr:hypothetical protein [Microbacterium bovistercoris]